MDKNITPNFAPLTYQEILGAVKDVIYSKLEIFPVSSHADVKTPASGIIVMTPDAPDIPKVNAEHGKNDGISGRFRSLDTLKSDNSSRGPPTEQLIIPKPCPLSSNIDNKDDRMNIDDGNDEKKDILKSSPSTLVRSDTYVREHELENATNDDELDKKNVFPQFTINDFGNLVFPTCDLNIPEFRTKLKTLRNSATEIVRTIDDIEKVVLDNTRPIRRLSTFGSYPGMNRALVTARTIQRPKMSRRSTMAIPGTPTSSRMSPGTMNNDFPMLKGITTASLLNIGGSKLSMPSAFRSVSSGSLKVAKNGNPSPLKGSGISNASTSKTITSTNRSASSGALKLSKKSHKSPTQGSRFSTVKTFKAPMLRSPSLSLMNLPNEIQQGRPTKNPKYAHIQSTIPKHVPVLGKRKAEEF